MALVIWKDDDDKYKGINVPKGDMERFFRQRHYLTVVYDIPLNQFEMYDAKIIYEHYMHQLSVADFVELISINLEMT